MGSASYREIGGPGGLLAEERPFNGHSMSAHFGPHWTVGRLPAEWVKRYTADKEEDGIRYCVVSRATPIAWIRRRDGLVVIPDVSYSVTTSRQQNLCRAWLIGPRDETPC